MKEQVTVGSRHRRFGGSRGGSRSSAGSSKLGVLARSDLAKAKKQGPKGGGLSRRGLIMMITNTKSWLSICSHCVCIHVAHPMDGVTTLDQGLGFIPVSSSGD